jgi:hypothetical protein
VSSDVVRGDLRSGEAAMSIIIKVPGDVFARFHAVTAKRRSRTRNSQFALLGLVLRATTTVVYMAAPFGNILGATSYLTSLTVAFPNVANAPKNVFIVSANRNSCLSLYFSQFIFSANLCTCTPLSRSVHYIWQCEQHICNLHTK